jgi:hypothetical protein
MLLKKHLSNLRNQKWWKLKEQKWKLLQPVEVLV